MSMIWIGHHQGTNQPYINPQKYNRKILSGIVQLPPLVRGAQEWETLAIDISIKQNSLSKKYQKNSWKLVLLFMIIFNHHSLSCPTWPNHPTMFYDCFWTYFIISYHILWSSVAHCWWMGCIRPSGWNYSRGLSPPFMGQNNFPTKQDNNLKFDKFNGWPFPRGLIMDPTPFWIIYVVKCDLWWFWKHFFLFYDILGPISWWMG